MIGSIKKLMKIGFKLCALPGMFLLELCLLLIAFLLVIFWKEMANKIIDDVMKFPDSSWYFSE